MVIPEHNLVRWPLRAISTTNKGQNVASEEHFDDADTSVHICTKIVIKFLAERNDLIQCLIWREKIHGPGHSGVLTSDELAAEGYRIKDTEPGLSSNSEAVLLLIESNVADFLRFASFDLSHYAD